MWLLENKNTKGTVKFPNQGAAQAHLDKLGPILAQHYRVVYESGDPATDRMLTEGLVAGDLNNILLPRVSVDEYVPADPETDNIVVAFFIKGEPKATLPLKNFADHSSGVLGTDYGDSETIMNTQIVYIEFDRENLDMDDIRDLMVQVSMLANLEPDDFTMTFPHTNKKFPYDVELMARYFTSRNNHKNRLAQQKAEKERQAQINKDLQRSQARHKEQELRDDPKPEKQSRQEEPSDEEPQGKQPETPLEALGDMPVKEDIASQLAKLALV